MQHFILDGRYGTLLSHYGVDVEQALRKAEVPVTVFQQVHPTMTEAQYYAFLAAVGDQLTDPTLPIKIATSDQIESFSPPIFAAYCSQNGRAFIKRLAQYKPLIGPMTFTLEKQDHSLAVTLTPGNSQYRLPPFLVLSEFAFLVGMLRKASQQKIVPTELMMTTPAEDQQVVAFFGCQPLSGSTNRIAFADVNLAQPFVSYNRAMWNYFEPEMTKRLAELTVDDSTSAQVRSALTELLPSGEFSVNDVSAKLGYSARTLQRKLRAENTTFQKQLSSTREVLALNYLKNSSMTTNDIAYLLGYNELNSFLRAFKVWQGVSVSEYRQHQ